MRMRSSVAALLTLACSSAGAAPWYATDFSALTRELPGPIGDNSNGQSFIVLPGVDSQALVFPVAVNAVGQPTIVAGFHGKGRFVVAGNWYQFYRPSTDAETKLSENVLLWLAGGKGDLSEVTVANRDDYSLPGPGKEYRSVGSPDRSSHDVYSAYSAYDFSDSDVPAILDFVSEGGGGLLLSGKLGLSSQSDYASAAANDIAVELGALVCGEEEWADRRGFDAAAADPPSEEDSYFVMPCRAKTTDGKDCVFPFTYQGNSYSSCTDAASSDRPWCATALRSSLDRAYTEWGYCASNEEDCEADIDVDVGDESARKRFRQELGYLANEKTNERREYDAVFQAVARFFVRNNNLDVYGRDRGFLSYAAHGNQEPGVHELLFLRDDMSDDVLTMKAVDVDVFPFDVAAGAQKAPPKTMVVQENTINSLYFTDDVWVSTGLYAGGGEIIDFEFEEGGGGLVGSGAMIQIGAHELDGGKWGEKYLNRSPLIQAMLPVTRAAHRLANPWGGPVFFRIPAQTDLAATRVTVSGAYDMPTFVLGACSTEEGLECVPSIYQGTRLESCSNGTRPWCATEVDPDTGIFTADNWGYCKNTCDSVNDAAFLSAVASTPVPWVEMLDPGRLSFLLSTSYASGAGSDIRPTEVMTFWREKLDLMDDFAGWNAATMWGDGDVGRPRPRMERIVPDMAVQGVAAYAGYPIHSQIFDSSQSADVIADYFDDRSNFPYVLYHELGHNHQQSYLVPGKYSTECTVYWYSSWLTLHTEGVESRIWNRTERWNFSLRTQVNHYNDVGRGLEAFYKFACFEVHSILGDKWGWNTYKEVQKRFLEDKSLQTWYPDASYDQIFERFALQYSKALGLNACEHFAWFSWPISDSVMQECRELPLMEDLITPLLAPEMADRTDCPSGWFAYGSACFYRSPEGGDLTWEEAKTKCVDLGGELATCLDQWESLKLGIDQYYGSSSFYSRKYWIGLEDQDGDGVYRWLDGTAAADSDVQWYKYYPDMAGEEGKCGRYDGGFVVTQWCGYSAGYICKTGGKQC